MKVSTPVPRLKKPLSMHNDRKPKMIAGPFDDNYIEYECGSDGKLTVRDCLGNIRQYIRDIIGYLKTFGI